MNPKISIAVDAKNKAVATLTGMVTVGAKIEVEVTGLPSGIESWASTDKWYGPSLRFRIVDPMGADLVRFPLTEKTSASATDGDQWQVVAATSSTPETYKTYNGTSTATVDCDTDLLRKAFLGVPFNETLEFGIILDSIVDAAQYATGKVKVKQWASASTEDPTVLPDWRDVVERIDNASASVTKVGSTATISITDTHGTTTTATVTDGTDGVSSSATVSKTGNAATITCTTGTQTTTATVYDGDGIPTGGTEGQVPRKTATATEWHTLTASDVGAVAVESGKGLSTNDYTTTDKNKLGGIADGAEVNVQSNWAETDTTSDAYIANKPPSLKNPNALTVQDANGSTLDTYDGSVAKTLKAGSNITLSTANNVTTISASGGGSGTITDVQVDGTSVVTSGVANITGKQDTANIEQSLSTSTTKYPSSNAVKTVTDNTVKKTGETTQSVSGELIVGDLNVVGGTKFAIVPSIPASPSSDTLYFIMGS